MFSLTRTLLLPCALLAQAVIAQTPVAPAPVFSMGQPPSWLTYASAMGERSSGSLKRALLVAGAERPFFNPVVGLAAADGEVYASSGSGRSNYGVRAIARTPALALGAGIDWSLARGRADVLLTYKSAIFRGGMFGRGTMLRVDWIPKRDNTLAIGIDVPLNQRLAGQTRPRHIETDLPDLPRPRELRGALPPAIEREMATVFGAARNLSACTSIWSKDDVAALPSSTCTAAESEYNSSRRRAFTVAARDSLAAHRTDSVAVTRMLADVIIAFDSTFGQAKDPQDNIDGLLALSLDRFGQWVDARSGLAAPEKQAVRVVYARWLDVVRRIHLDMLEEWKDSRFIWLPLRLAARVNDRASMDALFQRVVGQQFSTNNGTTYLQGRDLPLEIARSLFMARDYHVLWTHDVTSRRHGTHNLDNIGYELVADAYFPALTAAVKRYEATGKLTSYMIFLDQYFYEPRGGRLWMTILEEPLGASVSLPEEDKDREQHLRMRQEELRAAVAASPRLQADRARHGDKWLSSVVKVNVNITDPSDWSFRSSNIVPPFLFAPDNLMRDHRKIVFFDLTEADPYRGSLLMMGTGLGESFASPTWEDRGIRVHGPAALQARSALRQAMRANAFTEGQIPPLLRDNSAVADVDWTSQAGRAMQVQNEVGWGRKKASVARAAMYDLALPGSTIIVPDPQWVSPQWGAMLAGAAARGAKVYVIAPAFANAPTPDKSLQSLAHDVMLRMLELRDALRDEMRQSGGELRVGLFSARIPSDDPAGKLREVAEGTRKYPWLHSVFPFDSATRATLAQSEIRIASAGANATALAKDEFPRLQKLHQKTQLVALPGAIATLLRQRGWASAIAAMNEAQAEETAVITRQLESNASQQISGSVERRSDKLLLEFERSLSTRDLDRLALYFSVGTMNQDPRGLAFDGEASVITTGGQGVAGLVDLYYLMSRSTWLENKGELETLLPAGPRFLNWFARLIWPTM